MIFRQVIHDDLGCASYVVGDEQAGVAAVVDPKLDIDEYLEVARYLGVRIEHILETHNHADHVSGHGRLVAATGASMHLHRDAAPDYDHEPFDDGWELELGALRVRALHTPGHRPEHTAFLLTDTGRGDDAPWAVLTGDTLFVGDIARPDLAVDKEDGARGIFRSLRDKLLSLPPEVEVWPGHLGGSMCGGPGMDLKVASTIGFERAHTRVLQIDDEDAFVEAALADLGPQPPNFRTIVAINRGPLRREGVEAHPLAPRQVDQQRAGRSLLVDVRTELQFDDAHIPGAACVTMLRAGFGSKLAWLASADQEVVFVGRDDADGRKAVDLAAAVGVRNVAGYLHGGMTAWREEKLRVQSTARLSVDDLHERWDAGPDAVQILDVREQAEWDGGHIPGAVHVPYHDITGVPDGIDPAKPTAVICASGQRASVGASLLQRHGAQQVIHVVDGGLPLWRRRGWPIEEQPTLAR
ncbi:MAG: hydroxyacylglutathione hydrolase [Solirubrobacteraceae bacterium]|jgi:glyoxylase-like metal-dependent hydrolase (beta-lactamase superfamily II)/rhodanese-related sulfurtransferase|nr:hydroxyacylglutathione hydrolase [Solirubrobacteraceae bacterium]